MLGSDCSQLGLYVQLHTMPQYSYVRGWLAGWLAASAAMSSLFKIQTQWQDQEFKKHTERGEKELKEKQTFKLSRF